MEELRYRRGAGGEESVISLVSLMGESAGPKHPRVAVSSRRATLGRDRQRPFWLERSVLERYWEFDRCFQKIQEKA